MSLITAFVFRRQLWLVGSTVLGLASLAVPTHQPSLMESAARLALSLCGI